MRATSALRRSSDRLTRSVVAAAVGACVCAIVLNGLSPRVSGADTTLASTLTSMPLVSVRPGWTVASSSRRGVMVEYRNIRIGADTFRALLLDARTTLLRWHVGSTDPNHFAEVPRDAGPSIDWSSEGPAGVVAVFNGGFKQSAFAGGSMADGVTLVPPVRGLMTIALDAAGEWEMGTWGSVGFPTKGFRVISYRQNLSPLVLKGSLAPAGAAADWRRWGSPLNREPLEPRSGLGVDMQGNLIYVATMKGVLQSQVGEALIAAGAVTGMQLDINPNWPILGASFSPLHAEGSFPVQLPYSEHNPSVYETGWTRDFFVALAEPGNWSCSWSSRGLTGPPGAAQPQPLSLVGKTCNKPPSRQSRLSAN
ncbi:MAG: hypothetical protein JWM55_1017 [Acidimicrobiaceae bacterium]|nr:hypothetical protein [Acidimicrobiaceae bacterium]